MQKYISLFLMSTMSSILAFSTYAENSTVEAQQYLENRISSEDKRYPTFLSVLELLKKRNAQTLVETGTARDGDKNFAGDGGSTIIFGDWAMQNGALLYSVDITPSAIESSKNAAKEYGDHIRFVCSDSIVFLEQFKGSIDFLYLDSYDYDFTNPIPSQKHHLKEIEAAYPHLHKNSIVMIDDCGLTGGGKGKKVIRYLTSKGWVVFQSGYQVLLLQSN